MTDLIQPKEVVIGEKTFIISKLPATVGREIIYKYPVSNLPKLGDYEISEQTMIKMMAYVAVVIPDSGNQMRLSTKINIDNHVPCWEDLVELEKQMIEYNCSFFQNGKGLTFLGGLTALARKEATEMLMTLSGHSSQKK